MEDFTQLLIIWMIKGKHAFCSHQPTQYTWRMLHLHTLASMAPMDTGKSHKSTLIFPIFFSFSNGAAGGGGAGGWTAPHANVRISCSAGITTRDTRLCCQALASKNSNFCWSKSGLYCTICGLLSINFHIILTTQFGYYASLFPRNIWRWCHTKKFWTCMQFLAFFWITSVFWFRAGTSPEFRTIWKAVVISSIIHF